MTRRIPADALLRITIAALLAAIVLAGSVPIALAGDEPVEGDGYQSRGRSDERSEVLQPGDDDQPTVRQSKRSPYVNVAVNGSDARYVAPDSGQPPSDAWGRWIDAIRLFVLRLGFALRTPS